MNSKTTISLSTMAIAAVVLLFASGPIVASQHASAFVVVHRGWGWHGMGWHGGWGWHRGWGWHGGWGWHRHWWGHPWGWHRGWWGHRW